MQFARFPRSSGHVGFPGFGMFNTVLVDESFNDFHLHENSIKFLG